MLSVAATFTDDEAGGGNPLWGALHYPGGFPHGEEPPLKPFEVDFRKHMQPLPPATAGSNAAPLRVEVDVVVVGSGCGGAVAAAVLAEAGLSVLVVEKGPYMPPETMDGHELRAFRNLYEKAGLLSTTDGALGILAGACLGGGSTINWACCLAPPAEVRAEWADPGGAHRLPQFAPADATRAASEFDTSLAAVLARIGATADGVVHNGNNRKLIEGCEKLGYGWRVAPQNLADPSARSAGWTCFGEPHANKQGGLATFLADAAKAGARFLDRCFVERILHERAATSAGGAVRRATGILARLEDGRVLEVRAAKAVVVAAGALHSPCLLQRSGVGGGHVGRHLRLHPVTACVAEFEDEVVIYEGAPMTVVSDAAAAGPRGDAYGAKIECPSTHLGLMAAAITWRGGDDFVRMMRAHRRFASSIVLQRDGGAGADGGRVRPSADGATPQVDYALGAADQGSMLDTLELLIRTWVAAGCSSVSTLQSKVAAHAVAPGLRGKAAAADGNAPLEEYIRSVRACGMPPNGVGLFSAHQMGTCRMGYSPDTSVVDRDGEAWGVDCLYISDDSTFPTASGSNPMVTTLAIAHLVSSRLAQRLTSGDEAVLAAIQERALHRRAAHAQQRRRERMRFAVGVAVVAALLAPALGCWLGATATAAPAVLAPPPKQLRGRHGQKSQGRKGQGFRWPGR